MKDFIAHFSEPPQPAQSEWSEDDYDVLCEGAVVGRIMKAAAAPVGRSEP